MKIKEDGDRLVVDVRYLPYWRFVMFGSAFLGLVALFRPAESFTLMRYMTAGLLIVVIPIYMMIIGRIGIWSTFHIGPRAVMVIERKGLMSLTSGWYFEDVERAGLEIRDEGDVEYRLVLFLKDGQFAPLSFWKSGNRVKENYDAAAGRINGFISA